MSMLLLAIFLFLCSQTRASVSYDATNEQSAVNATYTYEGGARSYFMLSKPGQENQVGTFQA